MKFLKVFIISGIGAIYVDGFNCASLAVHEHNNSIKTQVFAELSKVEYLKDLIYHH